LLLFGGHLVLEHASHARDGLCLGSVLLLLPVVVLTLPVVLAGLLLDPLFLQVLVLLNAQAVG